MGIDIGTSSIKTVLLDEGGTRLSGHSRPHEILQPHPGYVEQDAKTAWWDGARECIRACLEEAKVNASHIAGICVSGMVPSFCPLDEHGEPVRHAILYRDNRAISQAGRISAAVGCKVTLQDVMPKLLWLKEEEPEHYARTRMVLNPHSYIVYHLTGQYSVDADIAAIFGEVFDSAGNRWRRERILSMGLDPSMLPPIFYPTDVVGRTTPQAARETGLPVGIPVIAGTGDSYTVLVGTGAVEANEGVIYLGTAATFLGLKRPLKDLRGIPLFETGDALFLANVLTGGEITRWFTQSILAGAPPSYDELESMARRIPEGSKGLYMLPHLLGARTPVPDPLAVGTLFGLTNGHTAAHLYRALLEGVAYALRDSYERAGFPLRRVVVSGGGSRCPLWRQILADVLRMELEYIPGADNAIGTAYLAGLSLGVFPDFSAMKNIWLKEKRIITPNPAAADQYDRHFALYRQLNEMIRPAYQLRSEVLEGSLE